MAEKRGSFGAPLEHIENIAEETKNYIELKFDHLKLKIVETLSSLLSTLAFATIFLLLIFGAVAFLATALSNYIGQLLDSKTLGSLITALLFVFCAIALFLFRKRVFKGVFIRLLSTQIVESPLQKEDVDKELLRVEQKIAVKELKLKGEYDNLKGALTFMNLLGQITKKITVVIPMILSLKGLYEKVKRVFKKEEEEVVEVETNSIEDSEL